MKDYRGWLAQLPRDQAERIAHGNAERLFGPRARASDQFFAFKTSPAAG